MSCILLKNDIRVAHTVFKVEGLAMIRELTHVHICCLLVTEKMLLGVVLLVVGIVACFLLRDRVIIAEVSICGNHT